MIFFFLTCTIKTCLFPKLYSRGGKTTNLAPDQLVKWRNELPFFKENSSWFWFDSKDLHSTVLHDPHFTNIMQNLIKSELF